MAIKIDLLPGYVKLERQRNRALLASLAVLGLIGSGLLMELQRKKLELKTINENLAVVQVIASRAQQTQATADTLVAETAPFTTASAFMLAAAKSGSERAALVNQIRQFIYENSVVTSIDVSNGQDLIIRATVRDPNEFARFFFNLRRASDVPPNNGPLLTGSPTVSGVGGFPPKLFIPPTPDPGQPVVVVYPIELQAAGKLKNPVVLPPDPTGGAAAAGAPGSQPGGGPPNGPPPTQ
jgi:hypothetical protein